MPHPVTVTTWPTAADFRAWLGADAVSAVTDATLVETVLDDAAAAVYGRIDPDKLPTDVDECPRAIHRAIILEAARLLYRRDAVHGVAAFGDIAIRLRTVDVDVEQLLAPWGLDPEP